MYRVLNKASGIPCFPKHNDPEHDCMLYRLLQEHPEQQEVDWPTGFAGGIAHRLDIATTGQLIAAVDLQSLQQIRELFRAKEITKTYYFLSAKKVKWKEHAIETAIAHDRKNKKRMVVQRGKNTPHRGKWLPARTTFRWLDERDGITVWQAQMRTGVMHQIRLHAAFAGIALLGDRLYGGGASLPSFPSDFALHHAGVRSPQLLPEYSPLPDWWPTWINIG